MLKKFNFSVLALLATFIMLSNGCATSNYLKGMTPTGEKVYLGVVPIENTGAYKSYQQSPKTDVNKQQYLFQRLKDAPKDLEYYHDGNWYSWLEAYRGGMWLIRNRYQKGQDTRQFLKKYVLRSETSNQLHLVRFPDGSIQIGYDILINELELLEKTINAKPTA